MTILETTFVIDILRGEERARQTMDELEAREPLLFIAAPTIMEIWSGAARSDRPAAERQKINALLESLNVLPLDPESAKEAG